jgi:site-specific recombinase XerD
MFKQAVREEYIQSNPCVDIGVLHETPKSKTILSPAEARKLFADSALSKVWNNDFRKFTMNLLAATTGMRLGEIKAIKFGCIHDSLREVRYSWADRTALSTSSTHSVAPVSSQIH